MVYTKTDSEIWRSPTSGRWTRSKAAEGVGMPGSWAIVAALTALLLTKGLCCLPGVWRGHSWTIGVLHSAPSSPNTVSASSRERIRLLERSAAVRVGLGAFHTLGPMFFSAALKAVLRLFPNRHTYSAAARGVGLLMGALIWDWIRISCPDVRRKGEKYVEAWIVALYAIKHPGRWSSQWGLELYAKFLSWLVRVWMVWYPVLAYPAVNKYFVHGLAILTPHGISLYCLHKVVDHNQNIEVPAASWWEWSNHVGVTTGALQLYRYWNEKSGGLCKSRKLSHRIKLIMNK